jgi:hypothetical protein
MKSFHHHGIAVAKPSLTKPVALGALLIYDDLPQLGRMHQ